MEAALVTIIITIFLGLIAYIWNRQTSNHDKLSDRMTEIEKTAVSKQDFLKFENDFKESINTIIKTLNGINDKVVTRETAELIAENKCNEKIMEHMKSCPFIKSTLNRN